MMKGGGVVTAPPNILAFIIDDFTMRDAIRALRQVRGVDASQTGVWTGGRSDFQWYRMHSEMNQCDPSRYSTITGVTGVRHGVTANALDAAFDWSAGSIFSTFRNHGYKVGLIGKLDHQDISTLPFATDYYALHNAHGLTNYGSFDLIENGTTVNYLGGDVTATEYNNLTDVLGYGLPPTIRTEASSADVYSGIVNPRYNPATNPAKFREFLALQTAGQPWLCFINPPNPHLGTQNPICPRFGGDSLGGGMANWWTSNSNRLTLNPAFFTIQSNPPAYISAMATFNSSQQNGEQNTERSMERASLQLDDQIILCMDAARAKDPNTIIVLLSDQGLNLGEKNIKEDKTDPYIHSNQMLFGISIPGMAGGDFQSSRILSNLDICPTLCALAGVPNPRASPDGVNFLTTNRASVPIHWIDGNDNVTTPTFRGVYTQGAMYVEYLSGADSGFKELFDMSGAVSGTPDPWQTANVAGLGPYAALQAALAAITV